MDLKNHEPSNSHYQLQISKDKFLDAVHSKHTAGFANSCLPKDKKQGHCKYNNAKLTVNSKSKKAAIKSIKTYKTDE